MLHFRTLSAGRPAKLFLLFVIAILAVACGGSAASTAGPLDTVGRAVSGAPSTTGDGAGAPAPSAAAAQPSGAPGGQNAIGLVDDARIVRTGTMQLDVTDVGKAVSAARDAIRGMGGYVGASTTSNQNDQPVASITYRIPVARWEDALAALRGLNGLTTKVVTEQTNAVEVTGQIVDLQARIKNLQASEIALQGIAEKATKVSDILEVQGQLTDVRGQIESLTGQLKEVSDRADYATMTVGFAVPVVAVEVAKKGWDPRVVIDDAMASMVGILQNLAGAGIWFAIVWLPVMIVVLIVVGILAWILRRTGILDRPAAGPGPGGWPGAGPTPGPDATPTA